MELATLDVANKGRVFFQARTYALGLLITLMLAACTNQNAATIENFSNVIRADMERRAEPVCTHALNLPGSWYVNFYGLADGLATYRALATVGLVAGPRERVVSSDPGAKVRYKITPEGAKYHRTVGFDVWSRSPQVEFCYAKLTLDRVVSFTEPADALGSYISEVTYTYDLKDIAPWAHDPAILEAFPEVANTLRDARKRQHTLTLTLSNDGWHVAH